MTQCEHNINNKHCRIASMLLGPDDEVAIQEKACEACKVLANPKTVNKVTLGMAIGNLMQKRKFDKAIHGHLMDALNGEMGAVRNTGPGTNLKRYLSWFATETTSCACKDRVNIMNTWGPDICTQNVDIILDWLEQSAAERKIPFVRFIAKILVLKAIAEARND